MIPIKFTAVPLSIQSSYSASVVLSAGADRGIKADNPPGEYYIHLVGGIRHIWRWPSSETAGGWYMAESDKWLPDAAMQQRIVEFFFRTWDTIGGDIQDSLRQQGDKWARKVLARGTLTPKEAYEMTVDNVYQHHSDEDAYTAWEIWHTADYEGSRKFVQSKLKGVGF